MQKNRIVGIDIGSRSIEMALLENGRLVDQAKLPTTFDPLKQCAKILKGIHTESIVATAYGRKLFAGSCRDQIVQTVTEIQAYALGARFLFPEVRTVLDIGGGDNQGNFFHGEGKRTKI